MKSNIKYRNSGLLLPYNIMAKYIFPSCQYIRWYSPL